MSVTATSPLRDEAALTRNATCFLCERQVNPEALAHRTGRFIFPGAGSMGASLICDDCRHTPDGERLAGRGWGHPWRGEIRCEACGRRVVVADRLRARFCSDACRDASRRQRREREARGCAVCGETFTPKRSDARYCSNACRQDAYRQRKAGRL